MAYLSYPSLGFTHKWNYFSYFRGMKVIHYCGLFILLNLCLSSCKSSKAVNEKAENSSEFNSSTITTPATQPVTEMDDSPLVSIEKGACHGTCPIYKMTIYNNGVCEFNGKRFCKKLGAYTASMSTIELDFLKQKIGLLDMENYPEEYQSMIPDFPSTEITTFTKDSKKSVWWRSGAPNELSEMAVVLDKFRTELDWVVDVNARLPVGTIENQMLIKLKEDIKASDFAKAYKEYQFKPVKELVPNKNYWLFEFDKNTISGIEMLNLLNKSEKIYNAEFNKELEQRH